MTHPFNSSTNGICPGPASRRGFLRMGLAGFSTLSLPGLLRLRAVNAAGDSGAKSAVIMVWKPGGC